MGVCGPASCQISPHLTGQQVDPCLCQLPGEEGKKEEEEEEEEEEKEEKYIGRARGDVALYM